MRVKWAAVFKYVWVSVSLFMLPLGLGACLVDDTGHYASFNLLPVMLVLSFPVGPLVLVVGAMVIDLPPFYSPLDYLLPWLVTFAAGYCQWFWIIPKLFGRCELTTLGLNSVPPPLTVANHAKNKSRAREHLRNKPHNRIVHFDHRGRTPLERVIFDNPESSQMLSEERCDLPRIDRFPGQLA